MCVETMCVLSDNEGITAAVVDTVVVAEVANIAVFEYSESYRKDVTGSSGGTCNVGVTPAGVRSLELSGDHAVGFNYMSLIGGMVTPLNLSLAEEPAKCLSATRHMFEGSSLDVFVM